MREIKFRGKRIDNGEWIFGYLVQDFIGVLTGTIGAYIIYCKSYYDGNGRVIPESVGQYTGLKDKNGKEIYEDDIVDVNAILGHGRNRQIIFRNGCFGFEAIPNHSENLCYLEVWTMDVEVIGTIYENPELLEVSNEEVQKKASSD